MTPSSPAPWLKPVLGVILLLALAGVVLLSVRRSHRESRDAEHRDNVVSQGPKVAVVKVEATAGLRRVTLPADVRAFAQATLYAKTAGYLKTLKVDKGDKVRQGQILGVIESPETDDLVASARSDLLVKKRFATRARALKPSGVLSQQELDQAESNLEVAAAGLAHAKALQEYEILRAPFDGVVTSRFLDPGALVQSQVPVLEVSDSNRVRISVYVGQDVAAFLKVGDAVTLRQDEKPGEPIEAQVTRLSGALDPRTRTELCEVWLDNRAYHIYPGTYVHLTLKVQVPPLPTAPSEVLFMRGDRLLAAVVEGTKVHFVTVEPGLTDGKTVQFRSGLKPGDLVALNFPSELADGATIQPVVVAELAVGTSPADGGISNP